MKIAPTRPWEIPAKKPYSALRVESYQMSPSPGALGAGWQPDRGVRRGWREGDELAAAGEMSDVEVADSLNSRGARTPDGKSFARTMVREMLSNPFYIGIVRWRGLRDELNPQGDRRRRKRTQAQEYPGEHEPIIDVKIWNALQAVRARRGCTNRGLPRPQRHQYLLQGIAVSSECGGRLTCVTCKGGPQCYQCRASDRGENCPAEYKTVREQDLVPAIDAMIAALTIPDDIMRAAADLAQFDDIAEQQVRRATEIKEEQRRLDAMFRRGRLAEAAWSREIDRLDTELATLASVPEPESDRPPLASLVDAWRVGDVIERREVLRALLAKIEVDVVGKRIAVWAPWPKWTAMFARCGKGGKT